MKESARSVLLEQHRVDTRFENHGLRFIALESEKPPSRQRVEGSEEGRRELADEVEELLRQPPLHLLAQICGHISGKRHRRTAATT